MKTTQGGQSTQLMLEVISVLDGLGIRYAIIGAMAVAMHGLVRASVDVDALIQTDNSTQKLKELLVQLKARELTVEHREGDVFDPVRGVISVEDSFGNRADLITGIQGVDIGAVSRAVRVPLLGTEVHVIALEDLIVMKAVAGGPVDIDDLKGVLQISGKVLNPQLLLSLIANFNGEQRNLLAKLLTEAGLSLHSSADNKA